MKRILGIGNALVDVMTLVEGIIFSGIQPAKG